MDLFLGIDGGGSKCKAIIVNQANEILGSGISGPANPLHGFNQATNSIIESTQLALKSACLDHISLSELTVGAGLAGVNLPSLFDQMNNWTHPFKHFFLAHDLCIANLGAHHSSQGAVIITGTGSCGFSSVGGDERLIGGHGFPQGDKASGAWFGLQACEQVLLSLDDLIPSSLMNKALLAQLSCESATDIVTVIAGKNATFYAQLANIVFDAAEQDDPIAINIIKDGVNYLALLAEKLLMDPEVRLSILGGLSTTLQPWLMASLSPALGQQIVQARSSPEFGAVLFARNTLASLTR